MISSLHPSMDYQLTTQKLGQPTFHFNTIDSTNSWLKQHPSKQHGTLVMADYQTQGRGRQQRKWEAPAGTSLMFSLFLDLNWAAEQTHWLTMLAGLSVVHAIQQVTDLTVRLKWPNDIVLPANQGYAKLGGILTEAIWQGESLQSAILGIGINVNMRPTDLPATTPPATSLLIAGNRPVNRILLLNAILTKLETYLAQAQQGHSPQTEWADQLLFLGESVRVTQAHQVIVGMATGVDHWGNLQVRDDAGILHTITAGDVYVRPEKL